MVLNWIQAVVVDDYEQHVNGQILKQINTMKNPISETPLPWAPVSDNLANTAPLV